MRFAAVLLVATSVGCVDRRVIDVPIDQYEFEYGFVVLRDEDGVATRVSPPFGVAEGALTFGALPAYDLDGNEEEMLLIALPEGTVRRAVEVFEASRAAQLEVYVTGATLLPLYEADGAAGEFLTIALPADTRVLRSDFEQELSDTSAPRELALRVPIAPEQCSRIDPAGLIPFGPTAEVIPGDPDESRENFFFVDWIEEDTAIAMTPRSLHLFRAGEQYTPIEVTSSSSGNHLGRQAMPEKRHVLGGYVLERDRGRVWLVGTVGETSNTGIIFELAVDRSSIAIVSTATLADASFVDVALSPERSPVILDGWGKIAVYEGGGVFSHLPEIGGFNPEDEIGLRIHGTDDVTHPYLASSRGRVHVFDARAGSWISERIPDAWLRLFPQEATFNATGLASSRTADGTLELWAAGSSSVLIHKIGAGPWEPFDITYPPRFQGCSRGTGTYPNLQPSEGFDSIRIVGEDVFLTVRDCTAALQIRPGTGCTALLTIDGVDAFSHPSDLQALDVLGDDVLVGGEDGRLYRGRLR